MMVQFGVAFVCIFKGIFCLPDVSGNMQSMKESER
jgi:hypothetical protein